MKKHKILGGLLLLGAFIFTMGFNEPAFADSKLNVKKLFDTLDEMQGLLNQLKDQIQPAWSQVLPAAERFQLVMNDEAVLDKETGLVWERSPSTDTINWTDAVFYCYNKIVGGRGGWRLPTVEELMSLVDRTQGPPTLPDGHLFQNVRSNFYWSASTVASGFGLALTVDFSDGVADASYNGYVWCVRGGQGHAWEGQ